tara:strand:- start:15242 stop:15586 length:345 start_codon:yes stop_codon:yes gene_type:complete
MPFKDLAKQREYQRKWQQQKIENAGGKAKGDVTFQKRKKMVEDAKSVPCERCGDVHPFYVMDLHHRDPSTKTKGGVPYQMKAGSLKSLREEIDKCMVLCANCHRYVHYDLDHTK